MSQGTKQSKQQGNFGFVGLIAWLHNQFWREAYAPRDNLFANVERSFFQAQVLVRCFYAAMLYVALTQLQRWQLFEQLAPLNTLWPVAWVSLVPWPVALYSVLGLFVVGAVLALVFTERRWARALAFLGCFQFYALYYSFNAISHRDHIFVLVAFMLILLVRVPYGSETETSKRMYLLSFFGAQAIILLTYTMTGLTKVLISARSFLNGGMTSFHPEALVNYVANAQLQGGETLLGPLLVGYPTLGFLLFASVIFFELFAFYVAFRPNLHRPYGVFMIGMHIGIATTIGLFFSTHLLTVALFLVASPFVPLTFRFWPTLHDVPMIGPFVTALKFKLGGRRRLAESDNTLSVYYGACRFCDRLVYRMLKGPLPANVFFGTRQSAPFSELQARYPYLETPDSLVLVSHSGAEERIFVRSEAALIALAASSGPQSYAFIFFLLVPPPLLDWGYRLVASARRPLPAERQLVQQVLRPERSVDVGIARVAQER